MQQLSLPGLPADTPATNRLFFAIFPDAHTATTVIAPLAQKLRSEHRLRGHPLAAERFHITLQHLDDFAEIPPQVVAAATEAGASLAAPPFEVTFDHVESFRKRSDSPFVLRGGSGLESLISLQQKLALALMKSGLVRYVRGRFTPHVTLLYDSELVAEQSIAPVRWTVREFTLVHSLVGQTRHIPLARWPLRG